MKDIESRADIEFLVNEFYKQVITDETIGYIFTEVAQFSLSTHLPVMYNFWESILFGNPVYKGNAMAKHIALNKLVPLQAAHFKQWLLLWQSTVSKYFLGNKAAEAISRARSIADVMKYKIDKGSIAISVKDKP